MGVTLSLASMLCFATNILLSRYALTRMHVESGFFIVLTVNVCVGAVLFGFEFAARNSTFVFRWKETLMFAAAGVVGAFLGRRLLFDAVRLLGPARTSVFHSCAPVPAVIFAWLLVGETLGPYELALMAVVLAGLWITHPPVAEQPVSRTDRAALRRGALLGLLTIVGFGASNVIRGYAMRLWHEAIFGALVGAAAAFVMQVATTRDWPRVMRGFREAPRSGYLLYAAGGVATMGGAIFLIHAMVHIEIALAVLVTHTTPLVVFPFSLIVLGNREGLKPRTFVGVGLVLTGIALLALR
jgi:drug/metabolite transporter (DMT)-like permease